MDTWMKSITGTFYSLRVLPAGEVRLLCYNYAAVNHDLSGWLQWNGLLYSGTLPDLLHSFILSAGLPRVRSWYCLEPLFQMIPLFHYLRVLLECDRRYVIGFNFFIALPQLIISWTVGILTTQMQWRQIQKYTKLIPRRRN